MNRAMLQRVLRFIMTGGLTTAVAYVSWMLC